MQEINRSSLSIMEYGAISRETIRRTFSENGGNTIFIESGKRFTGIITFGSWIRQENTDNMENWINRDCFKIPCRGNDAHLMAKEIFDGHELVNQIPVVDENNSLLFAMEREKCIPSSYQERIDACSESLNDLWPEWRSVKWRDKIRILIVDALEQEELTAFLQKVPCFTVKMVHFEELDRMGSQEFDIIADFYALAKRERASFYYLNFNCPVYDRLDLYSDLLQIPIWNRITVNHSLAFKKYLSISPYAKWRLSKGMLFTSLLVPIFKELGLQFEVGNDFEGNGITSYSGEGGGVQKDQPGVSLLVYINRAGASDAYFRQ